MPSIYLFIGAGLLSCFATAVVLPNQSSLRYANFTSADGGIYNLVDSYTSSNFFNSFTTFTGTDPTHGYVNYQSYASAVNSGLIKTTNNQVYMGVDSTTVNPPSPGRNSVRVYSNKAYNHGLFIADIAHMPGSICGVWPSFWMFGPNWPNSGEVDIIEGVHTASTNTITLHTSSGCSMSSMTHVQAGTTLTGTNCNANNGYDGCGASTTTANAYGDTFNSNGGGVYAMQWESTGIFIWFWPHSQVPADVTSGAPRTAGWGPPVAAFQSGNGCIVDQHFMNMNILFDTTFCGDWAGAVWSSSTCASKASNCNAFVSANPGAFAPAYWLLNSVKVYQLAS